MKKRKNVIYKKSVSLLAAAAMTAVLMTGQIYPVVAQTQIIEDLIETSSLIPDNVTIDFSGLMSPMCQRREYSPVK